MYINFNPIQDGEGGVGVGKKGLSLLLFPLLLLHTYEVAPKTFDPQNFIFNPFATLM